MTGMFIACALFLSLEPRPSRWLLRAMLTLALLAYLHEVAR